MSRDFVAVAFTSAGFIGPVTHGELSTCKAAAAAYRRREHGRRVYPVVKVVPWEDFNTLLIADQNKRWEAVRKVWA